MAQNVRKYLAGPWGAATPQTPRDWGLGPHTPSKSAFGLWEAFLIHKTDAPNSQTEACVPKTTAPGRYMRVGKHSGPLVIGGAEKKMEQENDFTYVPTFKVAGPLDEVREWLQENHPSELKEALKSSFNLENLKKVVSSKQPKLVRGSCSS